MTVLIDELKRELEPGDWFVSCFQQMGGGYLRYYQLLDYENDDRILVQEYRYEHDYTDLTKPHILLSTKKPKKIKFPRSVLWYPSDLMLSAVNAKNI